MKEFLKTENFLQLESEREGRRGSWRDVERERDLGPPCEKEDVGEA